MMSKTTEMTKAMNTINPPPTLLAPIHQKVLMLIVSRGLVTMDELTHMVQDLQTMPKIVQELLREKIIQEEEMAKLFAVGLDIPFVRLSGKTIDPDVLRIIPEELARKHLFVCYEKNKNIAKIALAEPYYLTTSSSGPLHNEQEKSGLRFQISVTTKADVLMALDGYLHKKEPEKKFDEQSYVTLPFIDLKKYVIPYSVLQRFPKDIATKYHMVVFNAPTDNELHVALVYPNDPQTQEILDYIGQRNNLTIKRFQASIDGFKEALTGYDRDKKSAIDESSSLKTISAKRIETQAKDESQVVVGSEGPRHLFDVKYEQGVPVIIERQTKAIRELAFETGAEDLEESNLDKVLKSTVKGGQDLVDVIVTGYVPKIVAALVGLAVNLKASDIHIEPLEHYLRVRFRIDGILQEVIRMPLSLRPSVISRIKILSNLKIDEQRIPQDGRFDAQSQGHIVDFRVSTLPTIHGEKVVLRVLDKSTGILTLEQLGLSGVGFDRVAEAVKKPWGVIMATGPTGSGKSTTLYAMLKRIASLKVNVITLEDPVEYEILGINQTQVKPKIGFSFAEGLRSVLRQDPNVIMVGEIRDKETAELVTHAALTGHLVLTTLHTNDAPGALPRLTNMGIEPFLITSVINAIIAQRLVRKLCEHCKKPTMLPAPIADMVKKELANIPNLPSPITFFTPGTCDKCQDGYKGRIGLFEVMSISEAVELATLQRKPTSELAAIAIKEGMTTMRQDGLIKVMKGLTSLDEVMKATTE